jgi:hypothetical protein
MVSSLKLLLQLFPLIKSPSQSPLEFPTNRFQPLNHSRFIRSAFLINNNNTNTTNIIHPFTTSNYTPPTNPSPTPTSRTHRMVSRPRFSASSAGIFFLVLSLSYQDERKRTLPLAKAK